MVRKKKKKDKKKKTPWWLRHGVWRDYGAESQGELRIGERKRERNNARSWRRGKNSFPFLCTLENRHLKLCGWSAPERDWKGGRVDKHTCTHTRTLTIECCDSVLCNQFYITVCDNICFFLRFNDKKGSKEQNDNIDSAPSFNPCPE